MLQKAKSFFLSIKKLLKQEKQPQQLSKKTRICKICFNEIKEASFHNLLCKDVTICHNCLLELKPTLKEFKLGEIKCLSIYPYNEKVQEILYKYKGCNDYELNTVFIEYYSTYLKEKFSGFTLIPAPSSEEACKRRGFHHVEEMFSNLKLPMICCVYKKEDYKQHDLSSNERALTKELLFIDDVDLEKKKILIVDDVFTTGATVKGMIDLIKTKNPKKIAVLVMAKTIDLDKREN